MKVKQKGKNIMKINNITNYFNKPSFGLRIKKDEGFQNFIKYAKSKNCNAKPNEITGFIKNLENMHYNNDNINSTELAFLNISKDSKKVRIATPIEEDDCLYELVDYKTRRDTVHTISYGLNDKKYEIRIKGKTFSLKDILTAISLDYLEFSKNK